MQKIILLMLLTTSCMFAQNIKKVEQYSYGTNGIEFILKNKSGKTLIISTFNSRPTIKDEVALNVYNYYKEKSPKDGDKITILAKEAKVIGTCKIKIKDNLTTVEFYYETVEWNTGLTEVYKNPKTSTSEAITTISND